MKKGFSNEWHVLIMYSLEWPDKVSVRPGVAGQVRMQMHDSTQWKFKGLISKRFGTRRVSLDQ